MIGAPWPVPFEKLIKVSAATAMNTNASAMDLKASPKVVEPLTAVAVAFAMDVTSKSETQTAMVIFTGAMNANQRNAKMNSR